MSNEKTGILWVPGFTGLIGIREDGASVYLGSSTAITVTSLQNVAGEFDQFVPASGKVLTLSNTLTLAGTDGTVMTFPSTSATIARTDAANTFTGVQAFAATGGIGAAGGLSFSARNCHTGGVKATASTDGTDATPSTTETYLAEVNVPATCTVTGVSIFNGSATGSGNITVYLGSAAGNQITGAGSASTAISGTDAYQRVPFTAPITLLGPATYFVLSQYNNTGSRFNTHIFGDFAAGKLTSTTYGTFPAAFTAPTTFTTGLGPIASLY